MTTMRDIIEEAERESLYKIRQKFTFKVGDLVICNGYPGVVEGHTVPGMVDVRLDRGHVTVTSSYPDCYPDNGLLPKDVELVGAPYREVQSAQYQRIGVPDPWRITQKLRVGNDIHEIQMEWQRRIEWSKSEQKKILERMRTELAQQLRMERSSLVAMESGKWKLP